MKIVFIGGVKFSHNILDHILKKGWDVPLICTYQKTKKKLYSDLEEFDDLVIQYKIKQIEVDNINDKKNIEIIKKIKPDLILVMGWSQILKPEIIRIPKLGVIGSHPTELPKFRGRAPIPWSIIKKLKTSALTFFYIDKDVDNGDILDQEKFNINSKDDATSLYKKITEIGKKMIIKNLGLINNGKAKRIRQNQCEFLEYWNKRTPDDGKINWSLDAEQIHNLIRATTFPYPGAFTNYNNKKLIIWKSSVIINKIKCPGKILGINNYGVKIGTNKGYLIIKNVTLGTTEKINSNKIFSEKDIGKIIK